MPSFSASAPGRGLLFSLVALGVSACNPFQCVTDSRSAEYVGRLGEPVAPSSIAIDDPGRIDIMLNETRGGISALGVIASVKIKGFTVGVTDIEVRAGTPNAPGRVLWRSRGGMFAGDSIWFDNGQFAGPGEWSDFWDSLNDGRAYFVVHSPSGSSFAAGLRQTTSSGFSPACT